MKKKNLLTNHIVYGIYFEYIYVLVAIIFDQHRDRAMPVKTILLINEDPFVLRTRISVFLCAGVNHR